MNRSMIRYLLAKLLLIEAALLIVPIIVALIYGEPLKIFLSIGATMAILLVLGGIGSYFKPKDLHIYAKEGVLIVALVGFFGPSSEPCPLFFLDRYRMLSMHSLRLALASPPRERLSSMMSVFSPTHCSFGAALPT